MFVKLALVLAILELTLACCPSGWVVHNESCYLFSQQSASYKDAKRFCSHFKGILVNIGSPSENAFVQGFALARKDHFYYMGLTDIQKEGEWRWDDTNEVASYIDWAPGQPDGRTGQNCMVLTSQEGYRWHDIACSEAHQYICERPQNSEMEVIG